MVDGTFPARRTFFLLCPDRLPADLRAAVSYRDLAAGQMLYYRGDPANAIFAVERGRLRLFSYTSEGKQVPLYVVSPGECVSEAALFADAYCGDVVAEMPSRVAAFPKKPLLMAFQRDPAFAAEFMQKLTRRFNLLRVRLELRSLESARERILQYLLVTAPPGQTSVTLDRPLKSIADDLGLSHESFYRTLTALIKEGLITRTKAAICFGAAISRKADNPASSST